MSTLGGIPLPFSGEGRVPRLKVLHIINGLGTGGAERSLSEMLPFFRAAGLESSLAVLFGRSEGVQSSVEELGVPIHFISARGWISRILEMRRLIKALQPNLIHTSLFESDVVGRVAASATGIPVVSSVVNMSYTKERLADPNVSTRRLELVRWIDSWTTAPSGLGVSRRHRIRPRPCRREAPSGR